MNMKNHILAALREEFDQWEAILASLSEGQIITPQPPSSWSIKDQVAHLYAWQQRTIARVEAALNGGEPVFPKWSTELNPTMEGDTDKINDWLYQTHRDLTWSTVYQNWKEGFQRFLEVSEKINEKDLLDPSRYSWMKEYPLVLYVIASYDHHQEHFEKLHE
jgi:hypothetical protein